MINWLRRMREYSTRPQVPHNSSSSDSSQYLRVLELIAPLIACKSITNKQTLEFNHKTWITTILSDIPASLTTLSLDSLKVRLISATIQLSILLGRDYALVMRTTVIMPRPCCYSPCEDRRENEKLKWNILTNLAKIFTSKINDWDWGEEGGSNEDTTWLQNSTYFGHLHIHS